MESKKINQLATELTPSLSDLTIIGDPTTGISKKITLSQMASLFTGTVEEYANVAAFPLVGTADTIYIALDTNVLYRWNGTAYVELSPNIVSSLVFNDANGFDGTINLVGSVATLTITTALTLGSLPFIGASGALTQDNANLFYDDTNNRLGIGTNAPTTPLDVFGSGIIARVNGTSTNNGFLGFSNAGTNKWSVGNVQSDHRFRIFSEANTAELVSILQTGEFGIGIANPTTKLHLDGGATALIANLDANVSVAKSISFRSDNSNRINLEVSGTESGSNAGANFFIRRYSDAGALIDTPLTITRSTGLITLGGNLTGLSGTFSSILFASAFIPTNSSIPTNGMYLSAANTLDFSTNSTNRLSITSDGNVGIGTAAPKLNTNNGTFLTVQGTNASGWFELATTSTSDGTGGLISFNNTNIAGSDKRVATIYGLRDGANNSAYLGFATNNAGSIAERMRITSGGNVGIGTASPSSGAGWTPKLVLEGTSSAIIIKGVNSQEVSIGSSAGMYIDALGCTVGTDNNIIFRNTNTNSSFSASERLRITSTGYVWLNNAISGFSGSAVALQINGQGIRNVGQIILHNSTDVSLTVPMACSAASTLTITGALSVTGSLSKGSGSFRIEHPLPSLSETHQLVHSFVEAPQADLYYRGKIKLVDGKGQANIDEIATMTEGTFEVLCRDIQCFTTNESGWDLVRGKVVGNIIYLESQNEKSTDEISWLVIGERKDKHIMETDWTDENGKVIVEPLKPIEQEPMEDLTEVVEPINESEPESKPKEEEPDTQTQPNN